MVTRGFFIAIFCMFVVVVCNVRGMGIPHMINYQGILLDGDGNPVTGDRSVEFLIYNVETEGVAIWSEIRQITMTEGSFNVLLGTVTPIPSLVFDSTSVYLALKVESDTEMKPRKQLVSVGYAYQAINADSLNGHSEHSFVKIGQSNSVSTGMIIPKIVSSIDGVSNDGGNVDLVEGSNVTITPDDGANTITISASGGTGGDDLGSHKATQNILLNGNWFSNDGDNEGIKISNTGYVGIFGSPLIPYELNVSGDINSTGKVYGDYVFARTGYIKTGTPSSTMGFGDIVATANVKADNNVISNTGYLVAGSPTSSYSAGDVVATDDLICDDDVIAGGSIITGSPTIAFTPGDIVATDDLMCDDDMNATGDVQAGGNVTAGANVISYGVIRTGAPSGSYDTGDIVSTDDLISDDDALIGDNLMVIDYVGINQATVSGSYPLYVNGSAYCTGSWSSSDMKFKKDITELKSPTNKLMKLRGVSFDWKIEEFQDKGFDEGKHFGLIAQEVEDVFPELVKEDENGDKAVNYDGMIPLLLEAFKEQQKRIESLEAKVNQLMD